MVPTRYAHSWAILSSQSSIVSPPQKCEEMAEPSKGRMGSFNLSARLTSEGPVSTRKFTLIALNSHQAFFSSLSLRCEKAISVLSNIQGLYWLLFLCSAHTGHKDKIAYGLYSILYVIFASKKKREKMKDLLQQLEQRHRNAAVNTYPATERVCEFSRRLMNLLFPEHNGVAITSGTALKEAIDETGRLLEELLAAIQPALPEGAARLSKQFMARLPEIYQLLVQDAEAIHQGDPAAPSLYEVIRAYPGFYAIGFYRIAHILYQLNIPLLPRMITEFAHSKTGIDIHPAATIGSHFCIDHGTGAVIGETTIIGNNVKIY